MTRVAIVTGGTRGIGAAITERLVSEGVDVAAVYTADDDAATALAQRLHDAPGRIALHRADIAERSDCRRVVADVLAAWGRVDHLVNNAGLLVEVSPRKMSDEDWDSAIAVNLAAPFFLAQAVLEPMIAAGFGRIVNVSSVTATMGNAAEAGYAAAKAGLFGLTRSLARSVARRGITVNCVIPGVFETAMTNAMSAEAQATIAGLIPLGRRGLPEELAHAVCFLLDERASYITGSMVTVDGGLSMGA